MGDTHSQILEVVGEDVGHALGRTLQHAADDESGGVAHHAAMTIHVRVLAGRDPHHIVEAQFKALARALRAAVALDPRVEGVPSTKGAL